MYRLDVCLCTNPSYTWFSESITQENGDSLDLVWATSLVECYCSRSHSWCIKGVLYCSLSVLPQADDGSGGLPDLRLAFDPGIQMP